MEKKDIKERLKAREPGIIEDAGLRPAAVLMPLFEKHEEWHMLFTLRSPDLPTHQNQISFPGGQIDEGEDALHAALREAEEELGIRPEDVEVIGRLDEIITITRFRITPFIALIPYPYTFRVSEDEIAEVIEIPLNSFMDPEIFRRDDSWRYEGKPYPVYYFTVGRHTVWGATARILKQFMELVMDWKEPKLG